MLLNLFMVVCLSLVFVFMNLDKKLLMLLSLEVSFLSLLILFTTSESQSCPLSVIMFILCSVMVIDSVFGLSLLISCGRSSSGSSLKKSIF